MNYRISGDITVPGDKSITHRACLFGSLAEGESQVTTNSLGRDNLACIRCMGQLGVRIEGDMTPAMLELARDEGLAQFGESGDEWCRLQIFGRGLRGLSAPGGVLDCGNSGTFARLLTGVLAGQAFPTKMTGDESLVTRPFRRVTEPLGRMGARFSGEKLPFTVSGGSLRGLSYESPHASAQVKSAVLLAGLQCSGRTEVIEPHRSRDHTERMLEAMGLPLIEERCADGRWLVALPESQGMRRLSPVLVRVPADFSSAAFFITAASIVPGSELWIRNVGCNATRTGLLSVLQRMGADIELHNQRESGGEPAVDLRVRAAPLKGVDVAAEDVVLAIDEIPILCAAAVLAEGRTVIRGAAELRVKESDRLAMTAAVLRSFGCEVEEFDDGLAVEGSGGRSDSFRQPANDAPWRTSGDHRIAMSGAVLELRATGAFEIQDKKAVETSFPGFAELLGSIVAWEQG